MARFMLDKYFVLLYPIIGNYYETNSFIQLLQILHMKKYLHILISLLLLISHLSLTVSTHLCGGEIVSSEIAFANIDLDCCGDKIIDCEETGNHECDLLKEVPCCENHYTTIDVVDDFVKSATQTTQNDFTAVLLFAVLNSNLLHEAGAKIYTDYSPPILKRNIQTLFQVFII